MEEFIPLNREFIPVPQTPEEIEVNEILSAFYPDKSKSWEDINLEFRCVILAEAGAGKTEEFKQKAKDIAQKGNPAFFIRIEDIEADFDNAIEIGNIDNFHKWIESTNEAWFFLDSVDEARLVNPRSFEKAIKKFSKLISDATHRAHIFISSRPYAWRQKADKRLLDELLFFPAKQEQKDNAGPNIGPLSSLTVNFMLPLDEERIRKFCTTRLVKNVEGLLNDIARLDLWNLAERPFDLEGVLAKWDKDEKLGGRLELLDHNINKRLTNGHNIDRAQLRSLNLEEARKGACRLAAAVILTGKPGINVPDSTPVKPGIEAESILADWRDAKDIQTLLECGIFNDVIYGAVRFRHRDIRELLAAEWFDDLLKKGKSRYSIENLFFREQYGENIMTPRLRSILPWLILKDDRILKRAQTILPEIVIEGGEPARLPLEERKKILRDIVERIFSKKVENNAQYNSSIARIANSDLSEETGQLIDKYLDNDDVIFFLARLVWQGEMSSCLAPLFDIALNSCRNNYARRESARAVMILGTMEQQKKLWQRLNENKAQLPSELLKVIVKSTEPDKFSIGQLLISLGKLLPYKRFETNELTRSLKDFFSRVPDNIDPEIVTNLVDNLFDFLKSPPHEKRRDFLISKEFSWLLIPTVHLLEKLIISRNQTSRNEKSLNILLMIPTLRYYHNDYLGKYIETLSETLPRWEELNDDLYWASIEHARSQNKRKSEGRLTDDWAITRIGHFWNFNLDSLPRLLEYVRLRERIEDKMVALSTAVRVFFQENRPAHILKALEDKVIGNKALKQQLDILLKPPKLDEKSKYEEDEAKVRREWEINKEQEKKNRDSWISDLKADPNKISNPPNVRPGNLTIDQHRLMNEVQEIISNTNKYSSYANWHVLNTEFGEAVARAYRDAAVNHWKQYHPKLPSEGAPPDRTPISLIFGLTGLEIESRENSDFPQYFDENQVRHALRYITWELNGFPSWLERMHQAFPKLVEEAVIKELQWELQNTQPGKTMHIILHDLVYHAPWLHSSLAEVMLEWVEKNPELINNNRSYCLKIITKGGTKPARLVKLAIQQIEQNHDSIIISYWYALFVDCDPGNGIPALEKWLSNLVAAEALEAAQIFITTLMGTRNTIEGGSTFNYFHTSKHLKSLYILMSKYIRIKEDIDRTDAGVFSPGLRDDAQEARSMLFNLLSAMPGKECYTVLKQLADEHPDQDYKPFMEKQAYKRAEEDGDLEPWSVKQVCEFENNQLITPLTHRQLFDLVVIRLKDLKNWLEDGNDSPAQTWKRAEEETEVRNLIAGWLNLNCREQYTTAQEPEIANSQRMDIWVNNPNTHSPVPIELKLLDKNWSGEKLCERLRNQLAGDYLRENSAGCGVMLLVWQGNDLPKHWIINGQRIDLRGLENALKLYWKSISDQYPGIETIEIIVIDLTKREKISNSSFPSWQNQKSK